MLLSISAPLVYYQQELLDLSQWASMIIGWEDYNSLFRSGRVLGVSLVSGFPLLSPNSTTRPGNNGNLQVFV